MKYFAECLLNTAGSVLILTKNKILVGIIMVASFLGFFFGFYAGIYSGIISAYVPAASSILDMR
jgi:hypothetical protein